MITLKKYFSLNVAEMPAINLNLSSESIEEKKWAIGNRQVSAATHY